MNKTSERTAFLLARRLEWAHRDADRIFAVLMAVQWVGGVLAALLISPRAWSGTTEEVHIHVWLAVILGGALSSLPIGLAIVAPGKTMTRQIIAVSQMLWSALLIHLSGGRIETHFHIFGSLAFLAFYKDWRVILTATVVVAADHALRGVYLPMSVYGISVAPWWRFLEHAGWVVFEDIVLLLSIRQSIAEMRNGASHQAEIEESRANVEQRVRERTAELSSVNEVLRRVSDENHRLFASITSILISFDAAGRLTKWNRASANLFATSAEDAIGKSLEDLATLWDNKDLTDSIEKCLALRQSVENREFTCKHAAGHKTILAVSITPIATVDGCLEGALLLGADMTDRRDLERQLAQAQKLESVGQLAAGIAHEINTPIQYIGDNVSFLRESFGELQTATNAYRTILAAHKNGILTPTIIDAAEQSVNGVDLDYLAGEIPQAIGQSIDGLEHVSKIVRAMKEFSHPDSDTKTQTDLNRTIENTITVARNEWKYVAEVVTELDADLPLVPCYAGEFNQALLNLIVNAAHAVSDRTGNGANGKGTITIATCQAGDGVSIRVKDTGNGIPEAIRSKIFDPFFTTKPVGKGTGQGLTIAHSVIVKKHGGTLTFETKIGSGTTFNIWLPVAKPTGVGAAAEEPMTCALT